MDVGPEEAPTQACFFPIHIRLPSSSSTEAGGNPAPFSSLVFISIERPSWKYRTEVLGLGPCIKREREGEKENFNINMRNNLKVLGSGIYMSGSGRESGGEVGWCWWIELGFVAGAGLGVEVKDGEGGEDGIGPELIYAFSPSGLTLLPSGGTDGDLPDFSTRRPPSHTPQTSFGVPWQQSLGRNQGINRRESNQEPSREITIIKLNSTFINKEGI